MTCSGVSSNLIMQQPSHTETFQTLQLHTGRSEQNAEFVLTTHHKHQNYNKVISHITCLYLPKLETIIIYWLLTWRTPAKFTRTACHEIEQMWIKTPHPPSPAEYRRVSSLQKEIKEKERFEHVYLQQ